MAKKKIKIGDNLEVEGLEELENLFEALPVAMQKEALSPAVIKTANDMAEEVRKRAPVHDKQTGHSHDEKYGHRPGFLRDSVQAKHFKNFKSTTLSLVGYGQAAFYGYFMEKGTSRMKKAHRFIRPAFQQFAPQAEIQMAEIAKDGMARAIEEAQNKAGVER